MRIMIVGSGGREHALAWKAKQSPKVSQVFVAPGNAGTSLEPGIENVAIQVDDIAGLLSFAEARDIDFELVAQKDKLRLYLRDHGKKVDVSNATATLTLLNGTDKQEVALVPQGEWLGAAGDFKIAKGTKVVAVVKQSGKTVTVRFVLP